MKDRNSEIIAALNILQINNSNITKDKIKKAYYEKCKIFHPDQYSDIIKKKKANEMYISIQNAYTLINSINIVELKNIIYLNNYGITNNYKKQREVRIFETNREAARLQKRINPEKKRNFSSVKLNSKNKIINKNISEEKKYTTYEEAMNKIHSVWIAEMIRRQIEYDKVQRNKENIKKLYEAFDKHNNNAGKFNEDK